MTTEVIRTRNRLLIRWDNESGERWAVSKWFHITKRNMMPADIKGPSHPHYDTAQAARQHEHELHYAAALAETIDHIFIRPEDFDRVAMGEWPTIGGYPAQIFPRDDGKIYIAIAESKD